MGTKNNQLKTESFASFCKIIAKGRKGLSLLEILIALTILGIAGTFITGKLMQNLAEGRQQSAKIQLQNIKARLEEFRRHCGFYPTTDQGLEALVQKPTSGRECKRYQPGGYIDGGRVPLDPWGYPFFYESDGRSITTLKSLGANGEPGGEGEDREITWDDDKI